MECSSVEITFWVFILNGKYWFDDDAVFSRYGKSTKNFAYSYRWTNGLEIFFLNLKHISSVNYEKIRENRTTLSIRFIVKSTRKPVDTTPNSFSLSRISNILYAHVSFHCSNFIISRTFRKLSTKIRNTRPCQNI